MADVTLLPTATTSPQGGGTAFDTINTGGGDDSDNSSSDNGGAAQSTLNTARWHTFSQNLGGLSPNDIQRIQGQFDWNASGQCDVSVDTDGSASANASAGADIFGGVSGSAGFFESAGVSISGPGPVNDSDSFSNGNTATATFTPNNLSSISGARCDASADSDAESGISGSTGHASSSVSIQIISPRINVRLTDRRVMVC